MIRLRLMAMLALVALPLGDPPGRLNRTSRGEGDLVVAGVALPGGVMARPDSANPILSGKNLYAADFVRNGDSWNLYYGGWRDENDRNDRIFAAVSVGAIPSGPWAGREVVVDRGDYVHVNDPSVQKRAADDWFMAFTVADRVGDRAWIGIVASRDGIEFTPKIADRTTEILLEGAVFTSVARPCLLWTGSIWKLWFDGKIAGGEEHSYLAECGDVVPKRFRFVREYPDVEGFPGFMEPDVVLADGVYVAVVQRKFRDLRKLVSRDGVNFEDVGLIVSALDPAFGRKRVSNPGWIQDGAGKLLGVGFGMTDAENLTEHAIGVAYHQYAVKLGSPGGVEHVYARSRGPNIAVPLTFRFTKFDRLTIEDPRTKAIIADEPIDSNSGDIWQLKIDAAGLNDKK